MYRDHADLLLEKGDLYRCWCSAERLAGLRAEAQSTGTAFKYDRYCLNPAHARSESEPHVLRFRIPDSPQVIGWDDAVRGHLEFRLDTLDDFVALKADGYPTYQFANVVDDHLMAISHVLRADEWIPSTPKHLLLFAAFDWTPPIYAHLPAVQGPSGGKKLSKRDGAQSVEEYIGEGDLPEALISFLASLGWNDGTTQEVFTRDELVAKFTLGRIQKSPARFDRERLTWMNGVVIRSLTHRELDTRCTDFWPTSAGTVTAEYREAVLGLVQERLKFLAELPELTEFFFEDPSPDRALLTKSLEAAEATSLLDSVHQALSAITWSHDALERTLRDFAEAAGIKTGILFSLIRVAVTGRTAAPGLFDTLQVLGRDVSLRRIRHALNTLSR